MIILREEPSVAILAPPLQKGKAKAEEHKGKVLTTKKESRTRTRLTQQEVIERYIQDHQDDWETKSAGAQQRFISELEAAAAWDVPSDTDSESEQSHAEVMSQPGSSRRNTPTASRSHVPPATTGGPKPTLTDLTRVVLDLGVAVGHITTQFVMITDITFPFSFFLLSQTRLHATELYSFSFCLSPLIPFDLPHFPQRLYTLGLKAVRYST